MKKNKGKRYGRRKKKRKQIYEVEKRMIKMRRQKKIVYTGEYEPLVGKKQQASEKQTHIEILGEGDKEIEREGPTKMEKKDEIHLPQQINTGTYISHPHTNPEAYAHKHTYTLVILVCNQEPETH